MMHLSGAGLQENFGRITRILSNTECQNDFAPHSRYLYLGL
jgi:hypothetical protein